ncbi:proteinase inhibitor, propeptide [Sphaerosporella brunnea]|uniref:Proteinase inhibitor, propeptide n=1 Tax=Sphaerosporella brunnea TaxID=1250544 RepID=A0A5J5F586_9PEZI|nr:proteinase inhibitor, propeptide [Sphaerosporella brunnea]
MKFPTLALALLAAAPSALATEKLYIVTFSNETPNSEVVAARDHLARNGCKITHEYTLIKGFAATCPEATMADYQVSAQSNKYKPTVEEDQVVTIWNGGSS